MQDRNCSFCYSLDMSLALIAFGLLTIAELVIYARPLWQFKKPTSAVLVVLLPLVTGFLLVNYFSLPMLVLCILNIYRVVNLLRIIENRLQPDYLYTVSRRTSGWLAGGQSLALLTDGLLQISHVNMLTFLYVTAGLQLIAAFLLYYWIQRNVRQANSLSVLSSYADRDLPALTVAIPARNETKDLEDCLNSLVANDYPKLEIIVLDDCSQNKHTPEIIRNFAQAGVRFIAGKVPPDDWLPKNWAYQQLVQSASGELVLFCGVDSQFELDSLRAMVKTLLSQDKTMVSWLPRNVQDESWRDLLIQPARYAWELALPRSRQRPPVLSTCWLIKRSFFKEAGDFSAVSRKIVPESYFAKMTSKTNGYSFVIADESVGLKSIKSFDGQRSTAVRMKYPQQHRRIEMAAITSLAQLAVHIWPLVILLVSALTLQPVLAAISGVSYLIATITYIKIVGLAFQKFDIKSWLVYPVAVIYDVGLLNYSMWQYEFGEVVWKGRNICLPVMRVVPKLPRLS